MALVIVLILIAVVVISIIVMSNNLNKALVKIDEADSGIDVALTKRYDVLTKMIETVKGYAKHENETFEEVIKARNTYVAAKTPEEEIAASGAVTEALSRLFALSENYPDLKANQNFLSLQNDLKDTEDKISYARQFYNDSVLTYNNKVEMVPSNIVAGIANFKKAAFFEANEQDKETPKVSF